MTTIQAQAQIPAFPGAEGAGALSKGGRGGTILEVTNLNDSGPGSLRAACLTNYPRIIVFKVNGIINLKSPIHFRDPYVTIAGQTSPGQGIIIKGNYLSFHENVHDVVIQHVNVLVGSEAGFSGQGGDCVSIGDGAHNLIFDHCSFGWSQDETIGIWTDSTPVYNITFSNNIIAEALNYDHPGSGFIVGSNTISDQIEGISIVKNMFSNNFNRNPLLKCKDGEIINNIIYNSEKYYTQLAGGIQLDIIGNSYVQGPESNGRSTILHRPHDGTPNTGPSGNPSIYFEDNRNRNNSGNWSELIEQTAVAHWGYPGSPPRKRSLNESYRRFNRLNTSAYTKYPVEIFKVDELEQSLLPSVGARKTINLNGDLVDNQNPFGTRIVDEYKQRVGKNPDVESEVGGYPFITQATAYVDTDKDGMSDVWEDKYGLNKNDASDGNRDADGDGYTNVEEFLNGSPTVAPPTEPSPTTKLTEGTYELHPASSPDKVVAAAEVGNGSNVTLAADTDQNNQRWLLSKQANGYYRLTSAAGVNQCLDAAGWGTKNSTNVLTWWAASNGQSNQEWKIALEDKAKGYYSLTPRHAEEAGLAMRLDVAGNSTNVGANFYLWTSHGGNNQRFILEKINNVSKRTVNTIDHKTAAVYPNPATSVFTVNNPNMTFTAIQVIDVQGKIVLEQKLTAPQQTINIQNLTKGLYLVKSLGNGETGIHKLLKN